MKLKIFTTVTNLPAFAQLQAQTFKKFVDSDYEFHLIDDSLNFSEQYIKICQHNSIFYHKKEEKIVPHHPSMSCAFAVQWTYDNLIKECKDDIVLFLDSDMFLFKKFDIIAYMQDKTIVGSYQNRGHVEYLWNGILFFNMPKVLNLKGNLDFGCGIVEGELTDVGGRTYHFIKENRSQIDFIAATYGGFYNGVELENMETFIDGKFFHFRGGTLWDQKVDVYERKLNILNDILEKL